MSIEEMIDEWLRLKSQKSKLNAELNEIKKKQKGIEAKLNLEDGYAKLPDGSFIVKTVRTGGGYYTNPWAKPAFVTATDMAKVNQHLSTLKRLA
jgi:hypothetical protein